MAIRWGSGGFGWFVTAALLLAPNVASVSTVHAAPQTFTVTSAADPGSGGCTASECTLREAIDAANANPGADTIKFDIPGGGVHTISPASGLPEITEAVTIDGYSQHGASVNSRKKGTNAVLLIELSGANAPVDTIGLVISAGPTTVRGLVINRFLSSGANGDAISIGAGATNTDNVIAGNFIGTDATGTRDQGNGGRGIECFSDCDRVVIGGFDLADRNLISGNEGTGIILFADDNRVQGNLIGTDKTGKHKLGNDDDGVFINSGVGNSILGNVIAFNGLSGITINGGTSADNSLLGNAIFKNTAGGIDLGNDGPTPNDAGSPPDTDTGPNGLQNFPVITAARPHKIQGTLATTPSTGVRLEFFVSPKGKQGKRFLGSLSGVSTDANGNLVFSFGTNKRLKGGQVITATATAAEGTSEFSAPKKIT